MYEKESPDPEAVGAEILEKVLVEGDEVRLVERSSFASIEEFFAHEETFGPAGFSMLLEEKDADTLRLAFSMENETAWNFVEIDRKGGSIETPEKTAFSVEFSLAQFSSRQIGTRADFSFQVPMPPESPMSLL